MWGICLVRLSRHLVRCFVWTSDVVNRLSQHKYLHDHFLFVRRAKMHGNVLVDVEPCAVSDESEWLLYWNMFAVRALLAVTNCWMGRFLVGSISISCTPSHETNVPGCWWIGCPLLKLFVLTTVAALCPSPMGAGRAERYRTTQSVTEPDIMSLSVWRESHNGYITSQQSTIGRQPLLHTTRC